MKTMRFWHHLSMPRYCLVPQAQIVTDETDESGGSEDLDDEVGAVGSSGIKKS